MEQQVVYIVGGAVRAQGGTYIRRPADDELLARCRAGLFSTLLTSRQMGKSSLRLDVAQHLRDEGIAVAAVDLNTIGTVGTDVAAWYSGLLEKIEADLRLKTSAMEWWDSRPGATPIARFIAFFREVVLREIATRIVVFFDEIDATRSLPFAADDFFAAIRALLDARAEEPDLARLSFVVIGAAAPRDLMKDAARTPFNVGAQVALSDFDLARADPLALGLGPAGSDVLREIFVWTGGHPYLTLKLCAEAAAHLARYGSLDLPTVADLVRDAFFAPNVRQDFNLTWVRDMLTVNAPDLSAVLRIWEAVLKGRRVDDEEASVAKSQLKLAGVVRVVDGRLVVRNRIYREAFGLIWLRQHLPGERLLVRYRRLAIAAGLAALTLLGVAGGLWVLYQRATSAEAEQRRQREKTEEAEQRVQGLLTESRRLQRDAAAQAARAQSATSAAIIARGEAEREAARALESERDSFARQLAAQSDLLRRQPGQLMLSSLLAIESARIKPLFENRLALESSIALAGLPTLSKADQHSPVVAGDSLLTIGRDGAVHVWEPTTGRERGRLSPPFVGTTVVGFSPNRRWLLTQRQDGMRLWGVSDGRSGVHLAPDQVLLFAVDAEVGVLSAGGRVRRLDASTGRQRASFVMPMRARRARADEKAVPDPVMIANHQGTMVASQDGNRVVIADARTGRRLSVLTAEGSPLIPRWFCETSLALLTQTDEGLIAVWDAMTGRELRRFDGAKVNGAPGSVSPDCSTLAYVDSGQVRVLDLATDRERTRFAVTGTVEGLSFSLGGIRLAVTSTDRIAVHDATDGRQLAGITMDEEPGSVALSQSLALKASYEDGKPIMVTDAGTGRVVARLDNSDAIAGVAFDSDDARLTAVGRQGEARVWDLTSGRVAVQVRHQIATRTLGMQASADGRRIVTFGDDSLLRVWDGATRTETTAIPAEINAGLFRTPEATLALSPDGQWVVLKVGTQLRIWDASTSREASPSDVHVERFEFATPNNWLAIEAIGEVVRWDLAEGRQRYRIEGRHVAVARDGSWLAVFDELGSQLRLVDAANGEVRHRVVTTQKVGNVEFPRTLARVVSSGDSKRIVLVFSDNAATVVDTVSGREMYRVLPARLSILAPPPVVAFSESGSALLISGPDPIVRIYDASTGEQRETLPHESPVIEVAAPRETQVLTQTADGVLHVWELSSIHSPLERVRIEHPEGPMRGIARVSNTDLVVTGGTSPGVRVWRVTNSRAHTRVMAPETVYHLAATRDGRRLAVAMVSTVEIWDTDSGARREVFRESKQESVHDLFLSPDGTTLIVEVWTPDVAAEKTRPRDILGLPMPQWEYRLELRDAATGESRGRVPLAGSLDSLTFTEDGKWFTAKTQYGGAGCVRRSVNGHESPHAPCTKGHDLVAAGAAVAVEREVRSFVHEIRVLDLETGRERYRGLRDAISKVALSSDGRWLATLSVREGGSIIDLTGRIPPARLAARDAATGRFVFSEDSRWLISDLSARNQGVIVWDVATGRRQHLPVGGLGLRFAFVQGSDWLFITVRQGARTPAILWDLRAGREVSRMELDLSHGEIEVVAGGQIVGFEGQNVEFQSLRTEDLARDLCARMVRAFTPAERQQYFATRTAAQPCLPGNVPASPSSRRTSK
jgi:WD40 repeat protein